LLSQAGTFENASYDACFTPNGGCDKKIIRTINRAKKQVLVQAYSFTSTPIADALVDAHKHGIDVEVLLDKSQLKGKGSVLPYLKKQNIETKIDCKPAIAHNKVMIIDGETVITGSYNFTESAEHKNAENLLIIRDKNLAEKYKNNWIKRNEVSK
jgi:phosphatidylserine/phosphatidylglycerophosphate/cardiolipin synthase-like enzyme